MILCLQMSRKGNNSSGHMVFPVEQLKSDLNKIIRPVYLIYGEEPQQLTEALDLVRATALNKGFTERVTLFAESGFDWNELRSALEVCPLFSDKTIVDLRLSGNQPNKVGSEIISDYLNQPNSDNVLLLSAQKLPKNTVKSTWLRLAKSIGMVKQFWPLSSKELLNWLAERASQRGLSIEREGINILAARVEGNMLAAAQEIEKLYIDFGERNLSGADIEQWVSDQSRYDVFSWVESTLEGKVSRSLRILNRMQLEEIAPLLINWAITRELRMLIDCCGEGSKPDLTVLERSGIWNKRKQILKRAASRLDKETLLKSQIYCSFIDRVIKGAEQGDAWQCLRELCAMIALAPNQCLPVELRDELSLKSF